MTFNPYQRLVADKYGDGDYSNVTTLDECRADAGDWLFTFLMVELADKEGCDSLDEATSRVKRAIDQLEDIYSELNNLYEVAA